MHDLETTEKLLEYLLGFVTENRKDKFDELIKHRTRYITVVLEDLFQPHNASAVLRSCDCFGIQDVHIIENRNTYNVNPDVALGASKWLTLDKYNEKEYNTADCYRQLRDRGYRIVATTPHTDGCLLDDLDLEAGKMALVFGTELEGLTEEAIARADEHVRIPMYGFTESFNISVSAALALYHLTEKMRSSSIDWHLTSEEIVYVKTAWAKSSIKSAGALEKEFLKQLSSPG